MRQKTEYCSPRSALGVTPGGVERGEAVLRIGPSGVPWYTAIAAEGLGVRAAQTTIDPEDRQRPEL